MNWAYYRDNLLAQKLLPNIFLISQDGFFVFRQNGAPAHQARDTVAFFHSPKLVPLNSSDLNPVDYSICGILQEKVYRSRIAKVQELKTCLIDEWERFDHAVDRGCCYHPVASLSQRLCPSERGILRATILTSIQIQLFCHLPMKGY